MAKAFDPQIVYCYHCGNRLQIGGRTKSTLCSGCNRTVLVEDIVVKRYFGVTNIETCGRLIVEKKGHAVAQQRVVALAGIEVEGRLHCRRALTAGLAVIGPRAEWEGDLSASSLIVEPGSVIRGGRFQVPSPSPPLTRDAPGP